VWGFATSSFCSGDVLWDGRCSKGETFANVFELASLQDHHDRGHLQHEAVAV